MYNQTSITALLIVLGLGVVLILLIKSGDLKEGFQRSELGQRSICNFNRSPVDYYLTNHWSQNPHYLGNPGSKFQPLHHGVDLYSQERRAPWSTGSLFPDVFIPSDTKTQYSLTGEGDYTVARQLDSFPESAVTNFATHLNLVGTRVGTGGF